MPSTLPQAGHALVYLTGELGPASGGRIAALIARAQSGAPATITADMSHVTFLDPRALGALVRAWRECAAGGTALRIRAPQHGVRRVLDSTGAGAMFGVALGAGAAGRP